MREACFCVLAGVLLALPVASPFEVKHVSIGHALTLNCSSEPGGDVAWRFKQPDRSDWLLVAKLDQGVFSPGTGFKGRLRSFYQEKPGNYSLVLDPVVYTDLGIYRCWGPNKALLSDVGLKILVPSLVSVELGMPASLPCYANIGKGAQAVKLNILWSRDGRTVYQLEKGTATYGPGFQNRVAHSLEQALLGNMSLTIKQTRFSDQGDFQCLYNRPRTSGNPDSAKLIVTGHRLLNLTVKAGESLSVPLHTADPVRVTLTRPGQGEVLLASVSQGLASYGGPCRQRCELLAWQKTLRLRAVELEDAGDYKVADAETNQTISTVSVQVPGPPPPPPSPAWKVAAIVVGVLLALVLVAGGFAVWRRRKLEQETEPGFKAMYEAAEAGDQDSFFCGLPVPESSFPEPGLPVSETEPSPLTQVQEKKSEDILLQETP